MDSCCFGGRYRSATVNIYVDITSKVSKVLIGYCSICNRKKSKTVSDNTKQAECTCDFFKDLWRKGLNVSKQMFKIVLKMLEELWRSVLTLVLHLHLEAQMRLHHHYQSWSTFITPGKGLYLGNFVKVFV